MDRLEIETQMSRMWQAMLQLTDEHLSSIASSQGSLDCLGEAVMTPASAQDVTCCVAGVVLFDIPRGGENLDWPAPEEFSRETGLPDAVSSALIGGYDALFSDCSDEHRCLFGEAALTEVRRLPLMAWWILFAIRGRHLPLTPSALGGSIVRG